MNLFLFLFFSKFLSKKKQQQQVSIFEKENIAEAILPKKISIHSKKVSNSSVEHSLHFNPSTLIAYKLKKLKSFLFSFKILTVFSMFLTSALITFIFVFKFYLDKRKEISDLIKMQEFIKELKKNSELERFINFLSNLDLEQKKDSTANNNVDPQDLINTFLNGRAAAAAAEAKKQLEEQKLKEYLEKEIEKYKKELESKGTTFSTEEQCFFANYMQTINIRPCFNTANYEEDFSGNELEINQKNFENLLEKFEKAFSSLKNNNFYHSIGRGIIDQIKIALGKFNKKKDENKEPITLNNEINDNFGEHNYYIFNSFFNLAKILSSKEGNLSQVNEYLDKLLNNNNNTWFFRYNKDFAQKVLNFLKSLPDADAEEDKFKKLQKVFWKNLNIFYVSIIANKEKINIYQNLEKGQKKSLQETQFLSLTAINLLTRNFKEGWEDDFSQTKLFIIEILTFISYFLYPALLLAMFCAWHFIAYTINYFKIKKKINNKKKYDELFKNYIISKEKKDKLINFIESYLYGAKLKTKPTICLFAGVAGTGKSVLAERIHKNLLNDFSKPVVIDGTQFKEFSAYTLTQLAKLLDTPNLPGVIVMDEIEKMDAKFRELFLILFSTGIFKASIIINNKAKIFEINLSKKLFILVGNTGQDIFTDENNFKLTQEEKELLCYQEIRNFFGKPNMSRIDEIFYFAVEDINDEILEMLLTNFKNELKKEKNVTLYLEKGISEIIPEEIYSYGFRKIENFMENEIIQLLLKLNCLTNAEALIFVDENEDLEIKVLTKQEAEVLRKKKEPEILLKKTKEKLKKENAINCN